MSASPSARDAAQLLVRKLDGVLGAGVGGVEVYTGVKVWLEVLADLYDADMEARIGNEFSRVGKFYRGHVHIDYKRDSRNGTVDIINIKYPNGKYSIPAQPSPGDMLGRQRLWTHARMSHLVITRRDNETIWLDYQVLYEQPKTGSELPFTLPAPDATPPRTAFQRVRDVFFPSSKNGY